MTSLTLFRAYNHSFRCASSLSQSLHSRIAQAHYTDARNYSVALIKKETDNEPVDVKPKSVPVHVAYQLLQDGHRYLDVRTSTEFVSGHPRGAINIPYMFTNGQDMVKNSDFLKQVLSRFKQDEEIIIGCRSGKRSLMAAYDLQSSGFTRVTDVAGGYQDWTQNGLPTAK
ncbi:hypothetical protein ACFE04_012286 [Oxalis oulophora]